jgi:hypothetical protein
VDLSAEWSRGQVTLEDTAPFKPVQAATPPVTNSYHS